MLGALLLVRLSVVFFLTRHFTFGVLVDIVDMPIGQIKPYKKNPRKNEKAVPEVVKSLREFGFRQPLVVDSNMVLIVGHTRLLAAKELGLTNVPVHIASTLTPAQVRAYRIMDNRTSDHAEWEKDTLLQELDDLLVDDGKYDLDFLGFVNDPLFDDDDWSSDLKKAEKEFDSIEENIDGILQTIKISCPQTLADSIKDAVKDLIAENEWNGVSIA